MCEAKSPDGGRIAENLLRNELIGETVRGAAQHSAFYADLYAGIDLELIRRVEDLRRLPTTTKESIRCAGPAARRRDCTIAYVQHTSGSTGEPLILHRSREEAVFIRKFFGTLHETDVESERPLMLVLADMHHGTSTPVPSPAFVITGSSLDREMTEQCRRDLTREHHIRGVSSRVTAVTGAHSLVCQLTHYLVETTASPADLAVASLHVTSRYLTERLRGILSRIWGATVVDRYSVSEVFGGATRCCRCDGFHFDPHVVPEVLSFAGDDPIEEGVGELALTTLHPFVTAQPMIRYRPGDVFAVAVSSCPSRSFFFCGRTSHSLRHPRDSTRVLVSGVDLLEAVDGYPLVRRGRSVGGERTGPPWQEWLGEPILRARQQEQDGQLILTIEVETVIHPEYDIHVLSELRHSIIGRLLGRSNYLSTLNRNGEVSINIVPLPPRSIDDQSFGKSTSIWNTI